MIVQNTAKLRAVLEQHATVHRFYIPDAKYLARGLNVVLTMNGYEYEALPSGVDYRAVRWTVSCVHQDRAATPDTLLELTHSLVQALAAAGYSSTVNAEAWEDALKRPVIPLDVYSSDQ